MITEGKLNNIYNSFDWKSTGIILLLFIIAVIFWDTFFIYPLRIFVVFIHELSHGLMAIFTGGKILKITLSSNEGGVTHTLGGNNFLITSAGYLGSALFGGLILYLSSFRKISKYIAIAISVIVFLSTIFFVRNFFGIIFGLLFSVALFVMALKVYESVRFYILRFLAVTNCLYAIIDIKSDLFSGSVRRSMTDAQHLADITHIPSIIWAILWGIMSIAILVGSIWLSTRRKREAVMNKQY